MNLISYILLAIVLVLFLAVSRCLHKGGGKRSCCKDCGSQSICHGSPDCHCNG